MNPGINRLYRVGENINCLCGCGLGGKVTKVDIKNSLYYFIGNEQVEDSAMMDLFHDDLEGLLKKKYVWNKPDLGDN